MITVEGVWANLTRYYRDVENFTERQLRDNGPIEIDDYVEAITACWEWLETAGELEGFQEAARSVGEKLLDRWRAEDG